MPVVNVELSEEDLQKLRVAYQATLSGLPVADQAAAPPTFEQWLGRSIVSNTNLAPSGDAGAGVGSMQLFNAIERLVTRLQRHGFELTYTSKSEPSAAKSALDLSHRLVDDLLLAPQYLTRIQQLLEHYWKTPKEIANASHVGVTNRTYGALHEAFRKLCDRTVDSVDHLGDQRSIGRVEGGSAILVTLGVLDRTAAQAKVSLFKAHVHEPKKNEWRRAE